MSGKKTPSAPASRRREAKPRRRKAVRPLSVRKRLVVAGALGVAFGLAFGAFAPMIAQRYAATDFRVANPTLAPIDRRAFFLDIQKDLFPRGLSRAQTEGVSALLDEWDASHRARDLRWLAYALATAYHETAQTMQPVEEVGKGVGRDYGAVDAETGKIYYGRGFAQLTWRENYAKLGRRLGLDLVRKPELALEPKNAARILYEGMIEGLFAGCALDDFFSARDDDWRGARCIINGRDRAGPISEYALAFRAALRHRKDSSGVFPAP